MSATTQVVTLGRGPNLYCDVKCIGVTIGGNGATYTAASGGLPFDLTTVLQTASAGMIPSGQAPNYTQTVNVADIVGVVLGTISTNGFLPLNFAVTFSGVTYNNIPWQSDNGTSNTPGALTACPCTIALYGTGASSGAALAQFPNGANSDTFTIWLWINANGANN